MVILTIAAKRTTASSSMGISFFIIFMQKTLHPPSDKKYNIQDNITINIFIYFLISGNINKNNIYLYK
jgi:hypothetical protein